MDEIIDLKDKMKKYINMEINVMQNLNMDELNNAINAIIDCRNRGGVIYTMGNGGSASTASHFVCDFAKGASDEIKGKKFLFECLSDNVPMLTAIANDIGYDEIFRYQLCGKLKKEDLLIAISGSGNSLNIINAAKYAKEIGTVVIGVTGYNGGKLREISDYKMHVAIDDMQITEDVHMMFDHMALRVVSQILK